MRTDIIQARLMIIYSLSLYSFMPLIVKEIKIRTFSWALGAGPAVPVGEIGPRLGWGSYSLRAAGTAEEGWPCGRGSSGKAEPLTDCEDLEAETHLSGPEYTLH